MELKIFNRRMFALIAGIALSTVAFAQSASAMPQTQTPQTEQLDDKAFNKQMADLQKQMSKLQKQMSKLRMDKSQQKLAMASKRLSRQFKMKFKDFGKDFKEFGKDFGKDFGKNFGADFGKNFAGSFSGMVPDSNSFKGFSNMSFSTDSGTSSMSFSTDSGIFSTSVSTGDQDQVEKIKNYSKTYSVDANDVLQINNSFGKITVNTWAKNEFKVDVQMKFGSDDADAVNDMFNGSSIEDSKVGSMVSFRTKLYDSNNGRNRHQSIEINYTVYMPAGNPIDINNKFGSVNLPDLSGKAFIKVSYGSLVAGQLSNPLNEIDLRFDDGRTSTVELFNNGKISMAYTKMKLGSANNIIADLKFSVMSVDRLKGSADVNLKYGEGLRIGIIEKTVKNINVDAQFSKINFDFKQLEDVTFDVTTKFGNFNYDDGRVKVTSKTPSDEDRGWSSTKSYKGYVGSNGSSNKIVINASYTGVSFN